MNERSKYALNGVYRCENFAQHLANNDFPFARIGSAAGCHNWMIELRKDSINKAVVYPLITPDGFYKELRVKVLFSVIKKDGSRSYIRTSYPSLGMNEGLVGLEMDILELLNEKNGYLDNGALVIEYGIQVESKLGMDNIWRFNTSDRLFDSDEKKNMMVFIRFKPNNLIQLFAHKMLFLFHSLDFEKSSERLKGCSVRRTITLDNYFVEIDNFVQISQGVQLKHLDAIYLAKVMCHTSLYNFPNVIRYCERQLIENDLKLYHMKSWVIHWDGLRHYLVHLLKDVKSPREMIDEDDIGKMEGETMKMFVAKFLYNKF